MHQTENFRGGTLNDPPVYTLEEKSGSKMNLISNTATTVCRPVKLCLSTAGATVLFALFPLSVETYGGWDLLSRDIYDKLCGETNIAGKEEMRNGEKLS